MTVPWIRGARAAFVFLTRIPVGGFPYTKDDFRWAGAYFPLVGAVLGAIAGVVMLALLPAGAMAAAICCVALSMMLTGAFHEDGLADTADALGGAYDREKLFVILKDSRVGSFGAAALFVVLALRVALLARLEHEALLACVLSACIARTPPVWMMAALPYVTNDEHSKSRHLTRGGPRQAWVATFLTAIVIASAMACGLSAVRVAVVLVALAVAAAICTWRFIVRAGGITGDFLGATEQVGECVVLLALAMTAGA
ncbi:adenosylcobinamide-GDP ribazoletransferase [Sandaracinus amylolyticus]|uniref:Adenosylcobinamide-GDP ribazoletransferase n=1 Tax=Sandaracinus amylolyticus TaxID=927083 RepID=A0A0F6W6W5_9BACT|nr:adenosylcobinamide-GDP ribazoletransferase [Sandaracinus amylolyticus]AKF08802.1 Cobalamin synthase [Sandaracinus amylolyticus]